MKKITPILLTVLLLTFSFSITGCKNFIQVDSNETESTQNASAELPGLNDKVSATDSEFIVHGVKAFKWNSGTYLIVDMTYTRLPSDEDANEDDWTVKNDYFYVFSDNARNESEQLHEISYDDLTETEENGLSVNPLDSLINIKRLYSDTYLQEGRTISGYLVYEYYEPFSQLEVQIGNLHVYVGANDIEIVTPNITETTPTDTTSAETTPTDTAPTDTAPTDTVPTDTVPTDTVLTDTTPTEVPAE